MRICSIKLVRSVLSTFGSPFDNAKALSSASLILWSGFSGSTAAAVAGASAVCRFSLTGGTWSTDFDARGGKGGGSCAAAVGTGSSNAALAASPPAARSSPVMSTAAAPACSSPQRLMESAGCEESQSAKAVDVPSSHCSHPRPADPESPLSPHNGSQVTGNHSPRDGESSGQNASRASPATKRLGSAECDFPERNPHGSKPAGS